MKISAFFIFLLFALGGCIQRFQPLLNSPPTGYLVAEGLINSGGGPAQITLSRTTQLDDSSFAYETGATVQVEGNDNSKYSFVYQGSGIYGITNLSLNSALQYRMRIKTTSGEEYLSDFVPVNITPPIDSVSWQADSGGIQIYAGTHDPSGNSRYFKWDYLETWEFHAPFIQELRYDTIIDPVRGPEPDITALGATDSAVYTCWQSAPSMQIVIGSSINLSSDVIARFPLTSIPSSSQKLSVEYSVLVNQYALTSAEFDFYQLMQKNTEETGSVFGAQPSQLQGNIHSLTNPGETVIGYIVFSTVQHNRIFIRRTQLPTYWETVISGCAPDSVRTFIPGPGDPYGNIKAAIYNQLVPTTIVTVEPGGYLQFLAVPRVCVNCTLTGTNIKPSFWQ
ncbi:MAG TPA: DUF4249 domain-containing protein [Puia sp.]|nr:DUF4249 domain-containing protein [Puia sp.]